MKGYRTILVNFALATLALPACSTSGDPRAGLARQIVAHNETGAALCRWQP